MRRAREQTRFSAVKLPYLQTNIPSSIYDSLSYLQPTNLCHSACLSVWLDHHATNHTCATCYCNFLVF